MRGRRAVLGLGASRRPPPTPPALAAQLPRPAQVEGTPAAPAGQVIVKFNSFWTVELEPGWSLLATHPLNRFDLPFTTLSGLVDADRFHDVGILFPAVWRDRDFTGVLPRGTPVAQCLPVPPRSRSTSCSRRSTPAGAARYDATADALLSGPGVYRKRFAPPRSGARGETAAERVEIEP